MSDTTPHPQSHLVTWLKANLVATVALSFTIAISCGGAVWTVSKWINTFENQISLNQTDVLRATHDVATLQGNIISLDARVNDLKARVLELHSMSDQADAALRARLDIIDALNKFTAERAMQPPLPPPYQPGPRR
jgi:uncharacterized protein YlxW (UPF0749 family)